MMQKNNGGLVKERFIKSQKKTIMISLFIVASFLLWSVINPKDYGVWLLEVFPALIGISLLALTYKRFRFTTLAYIFVAIHSIILIIGGHYTYAENPLFNWIKETLGLSRNYYDRVGHIAQGFFPAIIIKEILLRKTKLEKGKMLFFIVVCIALAISAAYELVEWGASLIVAPGTGNAFLATQGDIWDTQWDMLLAIVGAAASLVMFSREHDRQLELIGK